MNKAIAAGAAAIAVIILAGAPVLSQTTEEIRIGSLSALTGSASLPGQSQRNAVQLAIDEVNAKGGIKGRKVRLYVEDDQLSPIAAANAARKLVFQDKVFARVATPNSPTALAALEVTMEAKTPQFVIGVAPKITQMNNPYVVRMTPVDSILAETLVNYAVKAKKSDKIAILADSTDYGRGGRDSAIAALTKLGLKPVLVESFNNDDQDFSSQINKIKASGANSLVIWGFYVQGSRIISQAKKLGLQMPIFGSSGILQGNFIDLAGSAAEGVSIVSYFSANDAAAHVQDFVKRYKAAFNRDPDPIAASGYDGIKLLLAAIEKAGTNREAVMKEVLATKNYKGVSGLKTATPNGELGVDGIVLEIKNGVPVVAWRP